MFDARIYGVGYNTMVLNITGDTPRYVIRWGDATAPETVRTDRDDDGDDGFVEGLVHSYASDGTYDVSISQVGGGTPPERMRAYMYSGATNDVNIGGSRLDEIFTGGAGADFLRGAAGEDTIAGNDGADRLYGGDDDDFVLGGSGDDLLRGDAGVDLLGGGSGADRLYGGADTDYIYGDEDADGLFGEGGDDYLDGGRGADKLYGDETGMGYDTFAFSPDRDVEGIAIDDPDRDTVYGYQQGTDRLSVYQWFSGPWSFIGSNPFSGGGDFGELRSVVNGSRTIVSGDIDADGAADFSFQLAGVYTLQNSDVGIFDM